MPSHYPDRCTLLREPGCPRAILEGKRDDSLNPGTPADALRRVDPDDRTPTWPTARTCVQKGYSVGGVSQFKLQVDHRQGHPSCVIAGQPGPASTGPEPWIDVADGRWHEPGVPPHHATG